MRWQLNDSHFALDSKNKNDQKVFYENGLRVKRKQNFTWAFLWLCFDGFGIDDDGFTRSFEYDLIFFFRSDILFCYFHLLVFLLLGISRAY